MIVFNGITLESVANVKIEDIKVSSIKYDPVTRPRAIRFGSEFVRMGGGERTITITFALLDMDRITRHQAIMNISKWARTDAEYKLELPTEPNLYLECVCTSKPEPSTRQWWESKLRLTFTCFNNPYWTSKQEKSASFASYFNVLGDAPPLMRISRTVMGAEVSNQSYSDGTHTMTFSTIPVGNMVIDLNKQIAVVNNYSIMQYYEPSGHFIIPKTGEMYLTGTGAISYRERFE